jgi:hypothetical protein
MKSWAKKILIAGSVVWIIGAVSISMLIYPKPREVPKFTKPELLESVQKENKTHEENIAILNELSSKGTFYKSNDETNRILKETSSNLAFSIIHHQTEYNEKKQKSLFFLLNGLVFLLVMLGIFFLLTKQRDKNT